MSERVSNPTHTNRLARESSPYLLQHQHNPVDWYPWGAEAFEAARTQNKPIFLSVGYSTCYWCHVMERECFENEAIAQEMNSRFINIKVDREERPDVDQLYMTAVQVLTRHGGWPMSVFLTPDLLPFYGGTYFPPTDQHGRPGFVTVLRAIEDAYRNRSGEAQKSADQLVKILHQLAEPTPPDQPVTIDDALIAELIERSIGDYDPAHGGFGSAPKFPRETLLELLLVSNRTKPNERRWKMLLHTLDALAAGGIHDQLGGGFHRYSTDAQWLVPHFEIMLYDNAMLAWIYVDAYAQTEDRRYAEVARGIFDFVLREMTAPSGGFYTAFDAEVDAMEGQSYLWTADEIVSLLGQEDATLFNKVYGLDRGPNFADPHHGTGQPDKSILYLPKPLDAVAASMNLDVEELNQRLAPTRQKLYEARLKRKPPLLDTKILTSWNALMIRAFAYGGQVLSEQRYTDAAIRAADFLLRHHRLPDGGLYRTSRDGRAKTNGFLDDYAFLIQALLAMDEAGIDQRWRDHAANLAITMLEKFGDRGAVGKGVGGFFFTDKDATELIVRQKTGTDSPLSSGNAVAAMAMISLEQLEEARNTLAVFAQQMQSNGESMSAMIEAAMFYLRQAEPFTVSPGPGATAADRPLSPPQIAAGIVSVKTEWKTPTLLRVRLKIMKGFHINANQTTGDVPLIPTRISAETIDGAEVDYPPGEEQRFAFAEAPILVYSGAVTLALKFDSPPARGRPLRLTLSYQACDERSCLPPATQQIEVDHE